MERYIYLADHLEHLASQATFLTLLCVDLVTTHYDKLRCTSSSRDQCRLHLPHLAVGRVWDDIRLCLVPLFVQEWLAGDRSGFSQLVRAP